MAVLWVHDCCIAWANCKESRVEAFRIFDGPGHLHIVWVRHKFGRHAAGKQRLIVDGVYCRLPGAHKTPQRLNVARAWKAAGHADDSDIVVTWLRQGVILRTVPSLSSALE